VDFVEICNIYVRKTIITAAKRTFNSGKICRSYGDLNFGITFFGTQCIYICVVHSFITNNCELSMYAVSIKNETKMFFL